MGPVALAVAPTADTEAPHAGSVDATTFRQAMRQLAGGVCAISASDDDGRRTGMTVTSVVSLSLQPAELVVSINQNSSSWPVISRSGRFGVNLLDAGQATVAQRFAGVGGVQGAARYEGADWQQTDDGVWLLADAPVALACAVAQVWTRHSHALVVGRITAATGRVLQGQGAPAAPLLYWQGCYGGFVPG